MAFRFRRTHPYADDPSPEAALADDLALAESARYASDVGLLSRRAFNRAAAGFFAWAAVLESPAFAQSGPRKGYAIQGIVDRENLLNGVVKAIDPSRRTLSAAWGEVKPLLDARPRRAVRLGKTPPEFVLEREINGRRDERRRIDPRGIRDPMISPVDERDEYFKEPWAEARFGAFERESLAQIRGIMIAKNRDLLGQYEEDEAENIRYVVALHPTPVWCNEVGTVSKGARAVIPPMRALTYHGRKSNSVLIGHPDLLPAFGNGRDATFVDARNLVDLITKKRLYVAPKRLPKGHDPSRGCLNRKDAEAMCKGA